MPLSPRTTAPDPAKILIWSILGPLAALFVVIVLLAALVARQYFAPLAEARDLARAQRYADFAAIVFARSLPDTDAVRLTEEFRQAGIHTLRFVAPENAPDWPSPRLIHAGPWVEAWTLARDQSGTVRGAVTLRRQADALVLVRDSIRAFVVAAVFTLVLLGSLAWVLLQRRVTDRVGLIAREADAAAAPAPGADVIGHAHALVRAAKDRAARREAALDGRLDAHTELVCLGTAEGEVRDVNAAYCRFFGLRREEILGSSYLDFIQPGHRLEVLDHLRSLGPSRPEAVIEHPVTMRDGSVKWIRWRDRAVLGPGGKVDEILSFGTDMTAEKEAQEALSEVRDAYEQMQALALTGGITWDLSSNSMAWTAETRQLLGAAPDDECSVESLLSFVVPEDRDRLQQLCRKAKEEGVNFESEFSVQRPDGSRRVLQSRAELQADSKTKLLTRLTCALRDITALRDAERVNAAELRFRQALEQSLGAGIVVRDMQGKTLSANPAFCAMTGFTEAELKAAAPPDEPYWPDEDRPRILAALQEALAGHAPPGGFELVFRRKDGAKIDVLVNVSQLFGSRGEPYAIVGVVNDISAIQRTKRELAGTTRELRRELNYRGAVESSANVGLIAIGNDGRPFSVNRAYCEMLGFTKEEVLAWTPPYPCWPEEESEEIRRAFDMHLRGKSPREGFQLPLCRKDGTRLDVLITVSPILDADGGPAGFLSVLTDITALQQVRRELQVSNERLQIAQAVAEFGIWDWDPANGTLYWDRASFALFGHPDATDPKKVWSAVHSEEEQERLTYGLSRLIETGGKTGQDRIRATWPDGSTHEILSTYIIQRDGSGRATRVLGINRDITAELDEERELTSTRERLAVALEGGELGTWEHIFGLGAVNWNAANYELYGIDPAVKDPADLFRRWKDIIGAEFASIERALADLPVDRHTAAYNIAFRPAGSAEERKVRSSIYIERNSHGHPVRLVGVTRRLGA